MLMCPVEDLGAGTVGNEDNPGKTCDITIADILGPLILLNKEAADSMDRPRDANFSLLSYSFSLVGPTAPHGSLESAWCRTCDEPKAHSAKVQ